MEQKSKKHPLEGDLNVLGFFASTILLIARFVNEHLRDNEKAVEDIIQLCWKRAGVCAETKERSTVDKLYPELISSGWKGRNRYLKYKLPPGLSYKTVRKNIDILESYLKSEVIPNLLENRLSE